MSINRNLAIEKNLIKNEDDSKYKELEKKYKYLLEYYLNNIIDFKKYEKIIRDSNLYIGNNSKYKSLNEYLDLDYLFFMNRLFIEKLDKEDIDLLTNKFDYNNIPNTLLEMVKMTFKDIVKDDYLEDKYTENKYKVCYGPFVPFNFVDNDSLVFRLYYGKNLKELDGDAFLELHQQQLDFLKKLALDFSREMKEKTGIKCEVLIEKDIY